MRGPRERTDGRDVGGPQPRHRQADRTGADGPPLALEETRPEAEAAPAPTPAYPPAKRVLDVSLALLQLALTAPLWLLVPLLIRLEDGGPVFYTQERVGLGGERFTSYKFRSMTPLSEDGSGRGGAGEAPPRQAELEADRITRVGRLLRATALDELPQLLNILKGEMSYVGPRALLPREREANGDGRPVRLAELPGYGERHSVPPGLTGLAQVRAPRDLPHRDKFRYDRVYVRRRTLWLDLRLIARSVWISLRGRWPEVGREG